MTYSEEYTKIMQELLDKDPRFELIKKHGINVGIVVSGESKKRSRAPVLGMCSKISGEKNRFFIPHDVLITIYGPNITGLSLSQIRILIKHELMHILIEEGEEGNDPVIKLRPHDVEEFREIIAEYGYDWNKPENNQLTWDDYEEEEHEYEHDINNDQRTRDSDQPGSNGYAQIEEAK